MSKKDKIIKNLSKALTWENLADIYDKETNGRKARTLLMNDIFEWAQEQKDRFKVTKEDTIHEILKT